MKYILLFFLVGLVACSKSLETLEPQAQQAVEKWACADLQSSLFDVAYAALIDLKTIPTKEDFVRLFEKILDKRSVDFDRDEFLLSISNFYDLILSLPHRDVQSLLQKVAAAELGSRADAEAEKVQKDLSEIKNKWNEAVVKNQGECRSSKPPAPAPVKTRKNSVEYGAEKTLGVAYQSCEAMRKPAMTGQTLDVAGIVIVGTHPDGVGRRRMIGDLPALLRTEYYLQGFQLGPNCKDVRKSPLIYDYGGKPNTPSSNTIIDLFTNDGDGTAVLGIDCSGYVFTAIATAGLKLDPVKKLKPVLVHGINAALYKEPAQNGMPCLEKIKVGSAGTLRVGDIAAKEGHVVVIQAVGGDPLGISKAVSVEDCNKINSSNFDFVIAQSSPSKNGIGINKFVAKDYLPESVGMKSGFEKYAREACKARLKNQDVLISGQEVQVIRHKMTAACIDQAIPLTGEACLNECLAL